MDFTTMDDTADSTAAAALHEKRPEMRDAGTTR
jgi:hypothetical protein